MDPFEKLLITFPISLVLIFFFLRLVGNKELQQSTPIEFSFMVLLVSIGWDMTLGAYPMLQTLIIMGLLSVLIYLFDWVTFRSKKAEKVMVGEPVVLIKNGEVDEETLTKERMSLDELKTRLRLKGVFSIEKVEICYLEFTGEISVKTKE